MQHLNSKKAEIIYNLLGETLREEREKQKKSQRVLADEFDIQKSLISRLENGKNEPKLVSLWTVCNALDITIYELLERVCKKLPSDFTLIDN